MPRISTIIPIYNDEEVLNISVDSVLQQTLSDIEVILVNDGSTDNSPAIIEQYAQNDPRVKVIHKKNGGPSDARNAGLEKATGDYISFVDADDWIDPATYEELLEQIDLHDQPTMAWYHYYIVKENQTKLTPSFYCPKEDENTQSVLSTDIKGFLKNSSPSVCFALWKKDFLDSHRLRFIKGLYHEDVIFPWKAALLSKDVLLVFKGYYYYNQNVFNSVTRCINNNFQDFITCFIIQEKFLKQHDLFKEFKSVYQTRSIHYFNLVFKRAFKQRGLIYLHRYKDLKKFFDRMYKVCRYWDINDIEFTDIIEKKTFLAIQQKKFLRYLLTLSCLPLKLKAFFKYVIFNF